MNLLIREGIPVRDGAGNRVNGVVTQAEAGRGVVDATGERVAAHGELAAGLGQPIEGCGALTVEEPKVGDER